MRIDPTLAAQPIATVTASRAPRSGSPFALRERDGAPRRVATRSLSAPATLAALLAIQEGDEDGPGDRRRRAARRGGRLLDGLDRLKASLLAGRVSPETLRALEANLADGSPTGDPGLDEVVAAIELRAQVELAKLRAAGGR